MSRERELLDRLLEWQNYMGGFDSQVWRDTEEFVRTNPDRQMTDKTDTCLTAIWGVMDGEEWNADTLQQIADLLEFHGYKIRPA